MRLRRLPRLLAEMGSFWNPTPRLVPSTRKGRGQPPTARPKERKRLKLVDQPGQMAHLYQHTCFSATCTECGKVWLSAIRPIADNAVREGRKVYLCDFCR